MSINEIIMYSYGSFMIIGGIDKCIGNKLGLGNNLKKVSWRWGSLALSMVGITLAPVLANLFKSYRCSPSMNCWVLIRQCSRQQLLANDMGICSGDTISK